MMATNSRHLRKWLRAVEACFTQSRANSRSLYRSPLITVSPTPATGWYTRIRRAVSFTSSPRTRPHQHKLNVKSQSISCFRSTISQGTEGVHSGNPSQRAKVMTSLKTVNSAMTLVSEASSPIDDSKLLTGRRQRRHKILPLGKECQSQGVWIEHVCAMVRTLIFRSPPCVAKKSISSDLHTFGIDTMSGHRCEAIVIQLC
jgi:hypothetical protein